jgi:rubrerythrin
MKNMTQSNLQNALAGESQAHIRYLNFAERARKEKRPNTARLFEAVSASEAIHAGNHLKALDVVQDTAANLAVAKAGEDFEIAEMYPAYIVVAEMQAEKRARRSMQDALEAEKVHSVLFDKAGQELVAGEDISEAVYYVCPVCGFVMEGDPPDVCPVCGTKHEMFRKY